MKKKIFRNKIIYLLVHLHHQEMIIEIEVIIVHQIEVVVDQTKFLVEIKIDDDLDRDQGKNKI